MRQTIVRVQETFEAWIMPSKRSSNSIPRAGRRSWCPDVSGLIPARGTARRIFLAGAVPRIAFEPTNTEQIFLFFAVDPVGRDDGFDFLVGLEDVRSFDDAFGPGESGTPYNAWHPGRPSDISR